MENMLIQAPEDEGDFDILNDETFGDLGDGECDNQSYLIVEVHVNIMADP